MWRGHFCMRVPSFCPLINYSLWKKESVRVAQFFYKEKWSKDFGGYWMLQEPPIRAATNKMANIISHVRANLRM